MSSLIVAALVLTSQVPSGGMELRSSSTQTPIRAVAAWGTTKHGMVGIPGIGWLRVTNGRCHGASTDRPIGSLLVATAEKCRVTIGEKEVCVDATFVTPGGADEVVVRGCAGRTAQRFGVVREDWVPAPPANPPGVRPASPPPPSDTGLLIVSEGTRTGIFSGQDTQAVCVVACAPPDDARIARITAVHLDRNGGPTPFERGRPWFLVSEDGSMAYCYDSLYESNDDLELSFKTDSGREYRTVLSSFERIPFGESFARTIPAGCNTECCRNPRIPWSDVREHLHKLNVGIGTQTYRRRSVVH